MTNLPETPELLAVARRVVWFKPPFEALRDLPRFLAHVMTYGTIDDLLWLTGVVSPEDFLQALELAPPGVFDARSWAYWNLKLGRVAVPAMPVRRFAEHK